MQHHHELHQQPQMQYTSQQPVMMCPVQFLYDPQILVPPDEHVHQNQPYQNQTFLINVQNTPPWIQNAQRSNMVYVPQMQNTPYIQQNMVQNPIYNYRYQPMVMQQDIRQIPNMMNHNLMQNPGLVQNPPGLVQNPPGLVQNPPGLVQNPPGLVQNSPRLVQNPPGLVQNSPRLVQNPPNLVQNSPGLVKKSPGLVQNPPSLVQNSPSLVQNSSGSVQNSSGSVQHSPSLVQNPPNLIQSPPSMVQNPPSMIQNHPSLVQNHPSLVQNHPSLVHNPSCLVHNPQSVVQNPQRIMQNTPNIIRNHRIMLNMQNLAHNHQTLIQIPQSMAQPQHILLQKQQNITENPVRFQKQDLPVLTHILQSQLVRKPGNQQPESETAMQVEIPQHQTPQSQLITVNPMTTNTCPQHNSQNQKELIIQEQSDVPDFIRNQIPEGLSVKTVSPTATVRPNEYPLRNIAPGECAYSKICPKPLMKHCTMNTEPSITKKRKLQDMMEPNANDEKDAQPVMKGCLTKQELNIIRLNAFAARNGMLHKEQESSPQTEEKLLRNTVYVQARGRINEIQNDNSKTNGESNSAQNEQIQSKNNKINITSNYSVMIREPSENEVTEENNASNDEVISESHQPNNAGSSETEMNAMNTTNQNIHRKKLNIPIEKETVTKSEKQAQEKDKTVTEKPNENADESKSQTSPSNDAGDMNQSRKRMPKLENIKKHSIKENVNVKEKKRKYVSKKTDKELENIIQKPNEIMNIVLSNKDGEKTRKKSIVLGVDNFKNIDFVDNKSPHMKEGVVHKYVLTHVLDGHIIQESNVPFVVQKKTTIHPLKTQNTLGKFTSNNMEQKIPDIEESKISSTNTEENNISSDNKEKTKISSSNKDGTDISSGNKKETKISSSNKEETNKSSGNKKVTKTYSNNKKETKLSSNNRKEIKVSSNNKEDTKISSSNKEETKISSNNKKETKISSNNKEETKISSDNKEEPIISSKNKEKTKISSNNKEDIKISSSNKEETKISSDNKEEPIISSKNKEETKISSDNKGETKISSDNKEKPKLSTKNKEETKISSSNIEKTKISSDNKEEPIISSKNNQETKIPLTNIEETKISSSNIEETKISSTNIEETKISSTNKEEAKTSDNKDETKISSTNKEETHQINNKSETVTATNDKQTDELKLTKDDIDMDSGNDDDPFENISKSTMKTWSINDVFRHLKHPNWQETAETLRDQEIDGESLFLVNKDQLLQIGICDSHAQIISSFVEVQSSEN